MIEFPRSTSSTWTVSAFVHAPTDPFTHSLARSPGFGSWVSFDYQLDVPAAKALIKKAYESGVSFFDNAEVYAHGKSELIMGQALAELEIPRTDIVITTKVFHGATPDPEPTARGLSRKHVIEAVRASLKRLQLDYVDVVFAHRRDDSVRMEEVVRAFNWVMDQGWAFYWGTSEWSAAQIMEACEVADRLGLVAPCCEQPHYNLLHRKRCEHDLKPLIETRGLGLTTWSPLASGLLSGKYKFMDVPDDSRFAVERYKFLKDGLLHQENIDAVEKLRGHAEKHGVSMAQLALAWTMANTDVSVVLMGATKISQLEENLKAVELVAKFESGQLDWNEIGDAVSESTSVLSRF